MIFRGYNFSTNERLVDYTHTRVSDACDQVRVSDSAHVEEIYRYIGSFRTHLILEALSKIVNCKTVSPKLRKDIAHRALTSNSKLHKEISEDSSFTEQQKNFISTEIKIAQITNASYKYLRVT